MLNLRDLNRFLLLSSKQTHKQLKLFVCKSFNAADNFFSLAHDVHSFRYIAGLILRSFSEINYMLRTSKIQYPTLSKEVTYNVVR